MRGNIYLWGTSAEVAVGLLEMGRAGVEEVVCTHGDSFTLPTELIQRLGEEVIPVLR